MPVRREGRFATTPKELDDWFGKQSGKPVRVATETGALTAEAKARKNRPHAKSLRSDPVNL